MGKPHMLQTCAAVLLVGLALWAAVAWLGFMVFAEWVP